MKVVAIILAAGKGERFGTDKISLPLGGKPIWQWSFEAFLRHPLVDSVGLVGPATISHPKAFFACAGGASRQESARSGLAHCEPDDIVLFQDGARPFVSADEITRVVEAAKRSGAAGTAITMRDTIRKSGSHDLVDRDELMAMQTPQGGQASLFLKAHEASTGSSTDDLDLLHQVGIAFELVEGSASNFKITTKEDYERAKMVVGAMETRTGIGFDIHRFSTDSARKLWLGGIEFPEELALEGHSDADVVLHAITDSILGAAAMGDIGQHFPNTDPRWKNCDSSVFLQHAVSIVGAAGFELVNIDVTMIGEKPRVMPFAGQIRARIGELTGISIERIGFKATTNEGLGSIGRAEGISAFAVATLRFRG